MGYRMVGNFIDQVLTENTHLYYIHKCSKKIYVISLDFVLSVKIEGGEGGPSYLDEFKLKKREIVIRSISTE